MAYKYSSGTREFGDIEFEGDPADTQIDFEDDFIALKTAGNQVFVVSGSNVGIGTSTPDYTFDVAGDMGVDTSIYHNGDDDTFVRFLDDIVILKAAGKSIVRGDPAAGQIYINNGGHDLDLHVRNATTGTLLYTDAGNSMVGIGTATPAYTLDVAGNIGVDQYIYHNGDSNTHINFADDKIVLKAGNKAMVTMEEKSSSPHEVTINDGSNNIDFVVKGNGSGEGNPAFKVDASTNKVGINGVGTPDEALHVDGNIKVVGDDPRIKIDGDTDSHPGLELYENGTRKWIIYNDYTNDNLTLKTNSDDRVSIDQTGKVGIGTTSPDDILTINGVESNSDETYIHFQEAGSDRAKVGINTSNNLVLHNQYTNKHIVFKVNDAGVTREGLRINGAVPEVVVNEGSESLVDFRVEGDGQTHLLFTDGANDRVGISTSTPHSGLQIDNSVAFAARAITQNHTVTAADHTIFANATSTNITVTLPTAANIMGRQYIIKRVDSSVNSVTIDPDGSETIEGASTMTLTDQRSIVIQSDNSNWWIMAEYINPP